MPKTRSAGRCCCSTRAGWTVHLPRHGAARQPTRRMLLRAARHLPRSEATCRLGVACLYGVPREWSCGGASSRPAVLSTCPQSAHSCHLNRSGYLPRSRQSAPLRPARRPCPTSSSCASLEGTLITSGSNSPVRRAHLVRAGTSSMEVR